MTKELEPDVFIEKVDEMLTDELVNNTDVVDRAERIRRCIEKTGEEKFRKKQVAR